MRSSRICGIIKAEVCVICRRLRQITQTEALIIPHNLREPNSIIVTFHGKRYVNDISLKPAKKR